MSEDDFQYQQAGADDDRTVGQIEYWPMVCSVVDIQKIDNTTGGDPIP